MKPLKQLNLEFNICHQEIDMISSFLSSNPDFSIEYNFNAPLRLSISIGNLDVVKLLIQHGANIYDHNEHINEYKSSMLSESIISDKRAIFDYLLPFYNINDELVFNAFLKSIELNNTYYIEQFISNKINVNSFNDLALIIALSHNHIDTGLLLIESGADIANIKLNSSISLETKIWIKKYKKAIDFKNKLDENLAVKNIIQRQKI